MDTKEHPQAKTPVANQRISEKIETESEIEVLRKILKLVAQQLADKDRIVVRNAFIWITYEYGFRPSLIAYVLEMSEQSIYRILRRDPVPYAAAKEQRRKMLKRTKTKKSGN